MAAELSPLAGAGAQFFDNQGNVLAGGLLYTYLSGSTTNQATWTDSTQSVSNANPIVLDSAGRPTAEVWLTENALYKFVLKTSAGTTLGTWDGIMGIASARSSTISEWTESGLTPTYISTSSFRVPGDYTTTFTANRRVRYTIASGTFYGYVTTSTYDGTNTTVNITSDSTVLAASLQSVSYAALNATNPSVPQNYLRSGSAITGSVINNSPIGATTPSTGAFTNLSATNVTITGGTISGISGFSVPDYIYKYLGVI